MADFKFSGAGQDLNDAHLLGIGSFSGALGTPEGLQRDGYLESGALTLDADGGFEIEVLARQRMQLLQMGTTDGFPAGEVELLEERRVKRVQVRASEPELDQRRSVCPWTRPEVASKGFESKPEQVSPSWTN